MEYSGEGSIPRQIRVLIRRKKWERLLSRYSTEFSAVKVILVASGYEKICVFVMD